MPSTPSSAPPEAARRPRRLASVALGAAIIAAVGVAVVLLVRSDDSSSTLTGSGRPVCEARVRGSQAAVGDAAPVVRLPGLDGGCVDLSRLRGRPVVVNFWASWCNPCREEFPLLRDAAARHADADLAVVGIVYRDIPSDARRFAEEFGATWDLALDDDADAAKAYGVRAIPQTFFLDRDGRLAQRIFGFTRTRDLERHLREIL